MLWYHGTDMNNIYMTWIILDFLDDSDPMHFKPLEKVTSFLKMEFCLMSTMWNSCLSCQTCLLSTLKLVMTSVLLCLKCLPILHISESELRYYPWHIFCYFVLYMHSVVLNIHILACIGLCIHSSIHQFNHPSTHLSSILQSSHFLCRTFIDTYVKSLSIL